MNDDLRWRTENLRTLWKKQKILYWTASQQKDYLRQWEERRGMVKMMRRESERARERRSPGSQCGPAPGSRSEMWLNTLQSNKSNAYYNSHAALVCLSMLSLARSHKPISRPVVAKHELRKLMDPNSPNSHGPLQGGDPHAPQSERVRTLRTFSARKTAACVTKHTCNSRTANEKQITSIAQDFERERGVGGGVMFMSVSQQSEPSHFSLTHPVHSGSKLNEHLNITWPSLPLSGIIKPRPYRFDISERPSDSLGKRWMAVYQDLTEMCTALPF